MLHTNIAQRGSHKCVYPTICADMTQRPSRGRHQCYILISLNTNVKTIKLLNNSPLHPAAPNARRLPTADLLQNTQSLLTLAVPAAEVVIVNVKVPKLG
jgi:hypothetical protein